MSIENWDDEPIVIAAYPNATPATPAPGDETIKDGQKIRVCTPEQLLGIKAASILWHHGRCDMCGTQLVLCCHFGYNTQPHTDYRICKNCLAKNIQTILYGGHIFDDSSIDCFEILEDKQRGPR